MFQGRKPLKKVHLILSNFEDIFYLESKSNYQFLVYMARSLTTRNQIMLFCMEFNYLHALLRVSAACCQCLGPKGA